jgi:hypothetical protein
MSEPVIETEVFHLTEIDKTKYYSFALKTKTVGNRYYTTNPLQYLGRYIYSEVLEWTGGVRYNVAENFDDNGKKNRVVYDCEGNTCFVEVDPLDNLLRPEDSVNSLNSGEPRSSQIRQNKTYRE